MQAWLSTFKHSKNNFGLVSLHASVAAAFAFFLSYPYQDSVALIFGSVVLVSVSLIVTTQPNLELNLASS